MYCFQGKSRNYRQKFLSMITIMVNWSIFEISYANFLVDLILDGTIQTDYIISYELYEL